MQRPRAVLGVLGVLGCLWAGTACGIKAAPRPPLPEPPPPGTSQPQAQGDLVHGPLQPSLAPPDSGTP